MECIDNGSNNIRGYTVKAGVRLHRLVYCEHNNVTLESIKGKVVMHTCDNPRCINPAHLALGTYRENMKDMSQKLRGNNKLTHEQVAEIRSSGLTQRELAKIYGVSQVTISRIKRKIHY